MIARYINPDDEVGTSLQNAVYLNFDAADPQGSCHGFFRITV
jgi:hypothetical protein